MYCRKFCACLRCTFNTCRSFAAVRAIVTVGRFAIKRGNPKNFALVELFFRVALFQHFDGKIFPTVLANCLADNTVGAPVRGHSLAERCGRLADITFAVDLVGDFVNHSVHNAFRLSLTARRGRVRIKIGNRLCRVCGLSFIDAILTRRVFFVNRREFFDAEKFFV